MPLMRGTTGLLEVAGSNAEQQSRRKLRVSCGFHMIVLRPPGGPAHIAVGSSVTWGHSQ